ncbi:hypothetical protein ACIRJO_40455 [Streptomyces sp. NPDC102394]|uniref:hypothetical protein n=1 Tax=Streptomyces sp. NPDC102394 TaxID=3366167 RepID=UPI0038052BB5
MSTATDTRVKELADLFVRFLETNTAPEGLFTDDVFLDLTLPQWRLQARGPEEIVAMRRRSHPFLGTVPRHRLDATPTGFVLEFEESWEDGQGTWYCRELMRADVRDGRIAEAAVYCTGDWDQATRAAHAREVVLLRP